MTISMIVKGRYRPIAVLQEIVLESRSTLVPHLCRKGELASEIYEGSTRRI